MSQGLLPFKYEIEKREGGLTALGGVGLYLDLFRALGLGQILDRSIRIRCSDRGYADRQIGLLLILLNIVGGDCVEDLERLEQDDGTCQSSGFRIMPVNIYRWFRETSGRGLFKTAFTSSNDHLKRHFT